MRLRIIYYTASIWLRLLWRVRKNKKREENHIFSQLYARSLPHPKACKNAFWFNCINILLYYCVTYDVPARTTPNSISLQIARTNWKRTFPYCPSEKKMHIPRKECAAHLHPQNKNVWLYGFYLYFHLIC